MVVHICERCKKEFNKKSNYLQHLSKKNTCKLKAEIATTMVNLSNILEKKADLEMSKEEMINLKNEIEKQISFKKLIKLFTP